MKTTLQPEIKCKTQRSPYVAQGVKLPLPTQADLINRYWCFQLVLITVTPTPCLVRYTFYIATSSHI